MKTYREKFFIPALDFYESRGCNKDLLIRESKKVGSVFHTNYEKLVSKVHTRRGARKLLKWLSKKDIKSVIISNHTIEGIKKQLKRLSFEKYFSGVIANSELDTFVKKTSKKEKLKNYLSSSGISSKQAIIIGDSPEEVEMGRYTGIKSVSITNGHYSTSRLLKAHPDYIIDSLENLIPIFEKES